MWRKGGEGGFTHSIPGKTGFLWGRNYIFCYIIRQGGHSGKWRKLGVGGGGVGGGSAGCMGNGYEFVILWERWGKENVLGILMGNLEQ